MKFKSRKVEDGFRKSNENLQAVSFFMDGYMQYHFGIHLFITSTYRENSATHKRGDGEDARDNMTEAQGDELVRVTNERFDYGNGYLTIKDERKPGTSKNWTAPHLHIQANYRKRDRGWE